MSPKAASRCSEPAGLALTAAAFAVGVLWLRSLHAEGLVAYDFYGQFYPFLLHALQSIRAGGGLLWNPYQDCGQPFFGNSQTGLLYPGNLLFVLLDRETAYLTMVAVHLTIAGVGTFLLCRAMGVRRVASLCGALAFQLGWAVALLASWSPTHLAPLAWLPVAAWRTERLVRAPGPRGGLMLAAVLALQLLPGFPQTVFFTYQLIALRVLWAVLLRQCPRPRALLGAVALGLTLPLLLDAVQLLPSLEVARESVRSGGVSAAQLGTRFGWEGFGRALASHFGIRGNGLLLLLAALAVGSALGLGKSAHVAFWGMVAVGYFVLSLGPGSLLFEVYRHLPLGNTFRGPGRFLWLTSLAVAVLAALGSEALLACELHRTRLRRFALAVLAASAGAALCLTSGRLRAVDLLLVAAIPVLALLPPRPVLAQAGAALLPALILFDTLVVGSVPLFGLRRGDVYDAHAGVFAALRERLTPQDRVLIVGGHPDLGLMPKSATLFRVPNIHDYAPLASLRYAEFFTFMRTGRPMRSFRDWYWLFGKLLPRTVQRPLFDLTAARYLIVERRFDETEQAFHGGVRLLFERGGVRVYENDWAMPRARYVSRLVVLPDERVLPSLANGDVDARQAVAVSEAPPSGFTGSGASARAAAEIVLDDPERVVVRVRAPQAGFLFLADEYFPGWTATVDGQRAEILRADHAFRAVAVPRGESEVVFVYRPRSVRIGAIVSMVSVALVALVLYRQRALARSSVLS